MIAADEASAVARPAETIWCLVCRTFRPYRSAPIAAASRHFAAGFDTDSLVCNGCGTGLAIVRAKTESPDHAG